MKSIGLLVSVLSLLFLAACGGGTPFNSGTPPAGFTNASFSGTYVFTLTGQCISVCNSSSQISSVGYLVADGNGNITSGSVDLNIGGSYNGSPVTVSGNYAVHTDGTAAVNLNSSSNTFAFFITLSDPNGGYVVSNDGAWALSGVVEKQTTSAVAAAPSGNYVFRASGLTSGSLAWGMVGTMNFTTKAVTADTNQNGAIQQTPMQGTLTVTAYDSAHGRGTLTIAGTGGTPLPSMNFAFQVVDANTLELVSSDATYGLQGRAELTSGAVSGPTSGSSYAFVGAGFPVTGQIQVSEGGVFTANATGGISQGTIDTVFDNNGQTGVSFTGAGTVTSAGGATRDVLVLSPGSGQNVPAMKNLVLWLTSANRGFYLTTDVDRAETGTINVQSATSFTDNGTFAFGQNGWAIVSNVSTNSIEALTSASLFVSSNGNISGYTQTLNLGGSPGTNTGTGSLSFSGTIGSMTLNNTSIGTEDFRIYQYSSSNAFIMEVDQSAIAAGQMTMQTKQ